MGWKVEADLPPELWSDPIKNFNAHSSGWLNVTRIGLSGLKHSSGIYQGFQTLPLTDKPKKHCFVQNWDLKK